MPLTDASVLIITGMHRSGTSLTASFLAALGVELGNNLLKGDYGNPQGYFEDVEILTFQRQLLASCCRPHEPGFPDWGWTASEWLNQHKIQTHLTVAKQLIQARKPQSLIWGWKDPRTTLLLDFWHQILPQSYYILVYRYPWDVTDSLLRLNIPFFQADPESCLKIWRYYNFHLLDFYKRNSQQSLLIHVNSLIKYPEIFLNLLNAKLKRSNLEVKLDSKEQGKTLIQSIYNPQILKSLPLNHPLVKLLFQISSNNYFELLEQLDQAADLPSQFSRKLFLQEWASLETMTLKLYQQSIPSNLHPNSPQFLHLVSQTVQNYQNNIDSQLPLEELRKYRQKIARFWLTLESIKDVYENWAGKVHKILLKSGIKDEPLSDYEKDFVKELLGQFSQELNPSIFLRYLLALMLYQRAEQIFINYDRMALPRWFIDDFLQFILDLPQFFNQQEDIDKYTKYIYNLIDIIEFKLVQEEESMLWINIAKYFADLFNFMALYFTENNLKSLAIKRANILELLLQKAGYQLNIALEKRPPNRHKIRIGILKSSFELTSETLTTVPVFQFLNREKFEIIVYVLNKTETPLEEYCKSRVDQWVELPDELREQVEVIRNDNLDILFVGSILTTAAQPMILLALHRLARIQATYFASPMTTGISNMDYYISGTLTEPSDAATHYREKLVLIPGTGFCFNYNFEPVERDEKLNRNKLGIPEEAIVFISGANFFKIIPNLRETWAKILASVPNSVLVLYPFGSSWSKVYPKTPFIHSLYRRFEAYDVKPSRLILLDNLPSRSEVKAVLQLADVYLDSYPFGGANSLVDPLEVALPTVTWEGDYLRSRQGAALMKDLGLFDFIADSESTYIKLSISLGNSREFRQITRQKIEQKMPPSSLPNFLDSRTYSAQMGAVFENLWQRYYSEK
jgi:predicted O-linked N-acetylglucosamine transferase (SPINDLY family)